MLLGVDLMKRRLFALALAGSLGTGIQAQAQIQTILYQQNFDELILGDSVNERRGPQQNVFLTGVATLPDSQSRPAAFTHVGPNGWTVDNNFNNFGDFDVANANGTSVFSTDPEPKLLYKVAPVSRKWRRRMGRLELCK